MGGNEVFRKKVCKRCGKEFHVDGSDWGWKIKDTYFCSYSCMNGKPAPDLTKHPACAGRKLKKQGYKYKPY